MYTHTDMHMCLFSICLFVFFLFSVFFYNSFRAIKYALPHTHKLRDLSRGLSSNKSENDVSNVRIVVIEVKLNILHTHYLFEDVHSVMCGFVILCTATYQRSTMSIQKDE